MATVLMKCAACLALSACTFLPVPPEAHAQSDFRVNTTVDDDAIVMTDARTGQQILDTAGRSLHHYLPRWRAALEPEIDVRPMTNGVDLVYTFTNDRTIPMPIGTLVLDGLRLGDQFQTRAFNREGSRVPIGEGAPRAAFFMSYPQGPRTSYSPVAIMETDDHVLGISVLYPLMEYKHDVRGRIVRSRGNAASGRWAFNWKLSDTGNQSEQNSMDYEALLAPGETRTYTVTLRVTDNHDRWIETLEPYRAYFTDLYGGVEYDRDPRPVRPVSFAGVGATSPANPYGFRQQNKRPDLYGWRPILDWHKERGDLNNRRVMFWQPTGVYRTNRGNNFPFKFTSFWMEGDEHGHAMGDAPQEFKRLAAQANADIGFWWGNSCRIMREWDSAGFEVLDIDNPEHVALAFRELDLAVAAGAIDIGLDAFSAGAEIPTWDLERWMRMMLHRHPQLKFITERSKPDVLHRLGPTFFQAYNKNAQDPEDVDDLKLITEPFYLADFLLPGHETWLALRFILVEQADGVAVPRDFEQREFETALSNGYIPLAFGQVDWNDSDIAARSWETTVPPDLAPAWTPADEDSELGSGEGNGAPAPTPTPSTDEPPASAIDASAPGAVRTHKKPTR